MIAKAVDLKLAKLLLSGGIFAGPIYLAVGLLQILTRSGFDFTRHDWSLLSNGDLGWIQISNLIISGLLTISAAVGMRQVLSGKGKTWGPILIGLYGLGLVAAGIFTADPMNGFPPGSPAMTTISTHGLLHFISGAIGFIGLIVACFVFAKRFSSLKQSGWAKYSLITGILFFAAFFGIAMGSQPGSPFLTFVTLAFTAAVILGWTWLSMLSLKLKKEIE